MITLFVGGPEQPVADAALAHDPSAYLVDKTNYNEFLKNAQDATVYTSLADLPKISGDTNSAVILQIMHKADTIVHCPLADPPKTFSWDDEEVLLSFYLTNMKYLGKQVISHTNTGARFKEQYLHLRNRRSTDNRVLWVAGGSDTHGTGVEKEQRYGDIIAASLKIEPVYLAGIYLSIEYTADQILRSDIRAGDIVVWGLMPEMRAPYVRDGLVAPADHIAKPDIELLTGETRLYKAVTSVYQVINFCNKIGCQLVVLPMQASEHMWTSVSNESCYCHSPREYIDFGSDNVHPGPKHHQLLANLVLDHLG